MLILNSASFFCYFLPPFFFGSSSSVFFCSYLIFSNSALFAAIYLLYSIFILWSFPSPYSALIWWITLKSDDEWAAIFLGDEEKLRFFHFGGSEVGHGRRVSVLFVLVLPIFNQLVDFFFRWLVLVKVLRALVDALDLRLRKSYIKVFGVSLKFVVERRALFQ